MTPNSASLVLASGSVHRAQILRRAGLVFDQKPANVNERAIDETLPKNASPKERALALARAKAENVSAERKEAWIIGCDQILEYEGRVLHKVSDLQSAKERLRYLSGKVHHLHSAVALVRKEREVWTHVSSAAMTMRPLQPEAIEHYLAETGTEILSSVGLYQIEGRGIRLFEKMEGDFFSIIGLPLLPLLAVLRREKVIYD